MAVKVSTTSQRATAADRKVVFKSALENPYKVSWPSVPLNIQNIVLASLLNLLSGVGEYNGKRLIISKKRKHEEHSRKRKEKAESRKRRKANKWEVLSTVASKPEKSAEEVTEMVAEDGRSQAKLPEAPPVLSHLTIGINAVTKRLEAQAHSHRLKTGIKVSAQPSDGPPSTKETPAIKYVFVCRADVDPPLLIAHIPELVAACNVSIPSQFLSPVHLIPLPKDAERTLADALNLPRLSILALDAATPSLDSISGHLSTVNPPSAPWLTSTTDALAMRHVPTHIKQLCTTAPKDMRLAKNERIGGRRAANEVKKQLRDKTKRDSSLGPVAVTKSRIVKTKWKRRIKITASEVTAGESQAPNS